MGRKRKTIRLSTENEQYLRRVAWEAMSTLNAEINRIIAEKRKHDSQGTATHSTEGFIQ
jgi:hypothetical protein